MLRDSNPGPPEYHSEVLTTVQRRSELLYEQGLFRRYTMWRWLE
jgi:hypothetical protein